MGVVSSIDFPSIDSVLEGWGTSREEEDEVPRGSLRGGEEGRGTQQGAKGEESKSAPRMGNWNSRREVIMDREIEIERQKT